jgi:hypothetical protein
LLVAAIVGDVERTEALAGWIVRLSTILAIWSIWTISRSLSATEQPSEQRG